jgi:hypothetical protein
MTRLKDSDPEQPPLRFPPLASSSVCSLSRNTAVNLLACASCIAGITTNPATDVMPSATKLQPLSGLS